ncbi:MAG: hypothetical protein CVU48_02910 [Candidatus Cloacimonetes bacterium HGW-Cloacimonetes-1]|nr:MAG: hypothetical protein CVU48_02910 [Candidatus Cloacimonetes bacterium HGW-Cloacimonetes-1]
MIPGCDEGFTRESRGGHLGFEHGRRVVKAQNIVRKINMAYHNVIKWELCVKYIDSKCLEYAILLQ